MKQTVFVFGLLIYLLGARHLVLAQQPGQKPQPTPDDVVRVKTELVQTDLMVVDRKGRFVDRKVYRSVIRTKERMTYTNVNAFLVNERVAQPSGPPPHGVVVPHADDLRQRYGYLLADFTRMHELYDILRKRREARGSIDFDLPEAEVILDAAGVIDAIKPTERNVAHRIIEEFMLAANEVVASELVFANQPGIYRVHQQPDPQKLQDLREILQ